VKGGIAGEKERQEKKNHISLERRGRGSDCRAGMKPWSKAGEKEKVDQLGKKEES